MDMTLTSTYITLKDGYNMTLTTTYITLKYHSALLCKHCAFL